ncbi:MAG: hypothetical protein RR585_03380, partial [Coprobacillus sp.]
MSILHSPPILYSNVKSLRYHQLLKPITTKTHISRQKEVLFLYFMYNPPIIGKELEKMNKENNYVKKG